MCDDMLGEVNSVSLVSCSEMSGKNGVISFMRNFEKLGSAFEDKGVRVKSICGAGQSLTHVSSIKSVPRTKRNIWKGYIRNAVKNSSLGALLLIYFSYTRRAKDAYESYLRHGRSDVVFFQDVFCFFVARRDPAFNEGAIVIFHSGVDVLEQVRILFPGAARGIARRYIDRILEYNIKYADQVVTLSGAYKRKLESQYGVGKFHAIYNTAYLDVNLMAGFESDGPRRVDGKLNLVCVGSTQFRKGYDLLISAIASLDLCDRERVVLHIAGDGDQFQALQELCEFNDLRGQVRFYGAIEYPASIYGVGDIFCLPSRDEGLSISLLEAMSVGLPVFATPVGSIDEIFGPHEYIRVEVDAISMKRSLKSILDNELDLPNLGRLAKKIFEDRLSVEKFVANYSQIIKNASRGSVSHLAS